MDLNFFDSKDVPQPREQVRIERFDAAPYPDGWRIRLNVDVTPFLERPSLDIFVYRPEEGRLVAELTVIETMHKNMEFTVHVRGVPSPGGNYLAAVNLYYEDRNAVQDRRELPFHIGD